MILALACPLLYFVAGPAIYALNGKSGKALTCPRFIRP